MPSASGETLQKQEVRGGGDMTKAERLAEAKENALRLQQEMGRRHKEWCDADDRVNAAIVIRAYVQERWDHAMEEHEQARAKVRRIEAEEEPDGRETQTD